MNSALASIAAELATGPSRDLVSAWCEARLVIPAGKSQSPGPLSWRSREYMREPLDAWNVPGVTDLVLCFGSQTGKSTAFMAGAAWVLCESPSGILWVQPTQQLARSFSTTRWLPIVHSSPCLSTMIPQGNRRRTAYTILQQEFGASVLNFVGSNSPANLASRPARVVILDEVDKFPLEVRNEADAVNLSEQRTKSFSAPLRVKCSTPTDVDALIWQEFIKGDQRRYQVPCPFCRKPVIFAWSAQFTILPKTGNEAYIVWPESLRREDGTWDLNAVARKTHAKCPHCAGLIPDAAKSRMIRDGRWVPTATATATTGFRSYHLPSLYAVGTQTSWGALAVAFLRAKRSFLGLRGFINGALAEPFERQDLRTERVELVKDVLETPEKAVRLMTVDCQAGSPHFWYVVRQWHESESSGIAAGHCDTWEELHDVQIAHAVANEGVVVDSGWGARSDAEVYRQCARYCEIIKVRRQKSTGIMGLPYRAVGWMPSKGMPSRRAWKDSKGAACPYHIATVDPFRGTSEAGRVGMDLLEFSGETCKDILEGLRDSKRAATSGLVWAVATAMASEEYWRHMDAEFKDVITNRRTGKTSWQWRTRTQHWPNHLLDCEVQQVAAAILLGLLSLGDMEEPNGKPEP